MTKKQPAKRGPKTKWKDEFVEQAGKLALLGFIDQQLADFFGVALSTFALWKKEKKELSDTLKENGALADATVARSLYDRANGSVCVEERLIVVEGKVEKHEATKEYPPDTGACMAFLKNRQRVLWRQAPEVDSENETAQPIMVKIVREDASKK